VFFFKRLLREAVEDAQTGFPEMSTADFESTSFSVRLRRAIRSEKVKQPTSDADGNSPTKGGAEQKGKSLFTVRSEAAVLVTAFLRDVQKLFRNRLFKYIR
jgi:hypothetical protein